MKQLSVPMQSALEKLKESVNGEVDRFGNVLFMQNNKQYRYHPLKRVIRKEVRINLGNKKEWVRLNSFKVSNK